MIVWIWIYTFEDGTVLKLLDVGLSVEEIWKLQELHGKCKIESDETRIPRLDLDDILRIIDKYRNEVNE